MRTFSFLLKRSEDRLPLAATATLNFLLGLQAYASGPSPELADRIRAVAARFGFLFMPIEPPEEEFASIFCELFVYLERYRLNIRDHILA
jgi:hypothetical protein